MAPREMESKRAGGGATGRTTHKPAITLGSDTWCSDSRTSTAEGAVGFYLLQGKDRKWGLSAPASGSFFFF